MAKYLILSLSFGVLLFVVSFLAFDVYTKSKLESIDTYQKCADMGYAVVFSYPPKCTTPDGRTFADPNAIKVTPPEVKPFLPRENGVCNDYCGDGICQEIVCLGTGCPCAETAASCPIDCSADK